MKTTDVVMYVILAVIVLGIVVSFWHQHVSGNAFNLFDLLMENGRLSRLAAAFMLTLVVTSWVMIKLTIDGKMTEGYLMAFGGMWIAPIISKMFATNTGNTSSTTTTVSIEATKSK